MQRHVAFVFPANVRFFPIRVIMAAMTIRPRLHPIAFAPARFGGACADRPVPPAARSRFGRLPAPIRHSQPLAGPGLVFLPKPGQTKNPVNAVRPSSGRNSSLKTSGEHRRLSQFKPI